MTSDIGAVCRQYAYVPVRSTPYDERLVSLVDGLHKRYQSGLSAVESQRKQLMLFRDQQSEYSSLVMETIKRIFPKGRKKVDPQKIAELRGELEKGIGDLERLQSSLQEAYNQEARAIYDFSTSLNELEGLMEDYSSRQQEISDQLQPELGLNVDCADHSISQYIDNQKLLNSLILLKNEIIFPNFNLSISSGSCRANQNRDRSLRLAKISGEYLTLGHDQEIAKLQYATYKPLVDEHKQVAESLSVMRKEVGVETATAKATLMACQLITETELLLGEAPLVTDHLQQKIQRLRKEMNLVDHEFSRRVLETIFGGDTQSLGELPLHGVGHEVVKHMSCVEKGSSS